MEQNQSTSQSTSPVISSISDKNGYAIASLILGISSLVMAPIFVITLLAWPTSMVAIVLGALGIKSTHKRKAIAGLVLGSVALIALIGIYTYNKINGPEILINLGL
jgi:hypothetical protein